MDNKKYWRETLAPYTKKSNSIAIWQLVNTFIPYFLVWYFYLETKVYSEWLILPFAILQSFLILRFFVLMHDCGHGALFDSVLANKFTGYILGVFTGMPQFVWSKHHAYHHTTNGNWEKYHGPLNIISTEAYAKLTDRQQKMYWVFRHPAFILIGGFYYVLFNPRFTWFMGSLSVGLNLIKSFVPGSKMSFSGVAQAWESKYWKTPKEYVHMSYNNLTLLSLWAMMIYLVGAGSFFGFYILSLSVAGALGILFFTLQHNFEGSYATDTANVDYYRAALEGTSYLKLGTILNWFTADIAYHHIHHLSTSVPNYNLARCHKELKDLFPMVRRIPLMEIPKSFKYQLWDMDKQIIVSPAEFSAHLKVNEEPLKQ